jgi:hypothetical protein
MVTFKFKIIELWLGRCKQRCRVQPTLHHKPTKGHAFFGIITRRLLTTCLLKVASTLNLINPYKNVWALPFELQKLKLNNSPRARQRVIIKIEMSIFI